MIDQILFFDGECGLCNGFVDFLLQRELGANFKFAPLQGARARELLPEPLRREMSTVVLWRRGEVFTHSEAVLMVLEELGGAWCFTRLFWLVPKGVRNSVYSFVANRRYAFFGKRETCRLPTPAERARFLD